jgi:thiopeptide-type bacteriocin biosynthesis protein
MKRPRTPQGFFDPLEWAVMRAPLLPIESYLALADEDSPANIHWRTEGDHAVPADPLVKLALSVGSGQLVDALDRRGGSDPDVRGKLLRYQIRMSTRPTPYGMFAGVALAGFGQSTAIALEDGSPTWRARPDMEWLLSFVGALEARPEVRRHLHVVAHPAAFARSGRVFLSDATPLKDAAEPASVSVRESRAVSSALARARSFVSYLELTEDLRKEFDVEADKVEELLTELWRQGLLLTDLRPPLTTASPAHYVAERLQSLPEPVPEAGDLRGALDALGEWNRLPPAEAAARWPGLKTMLVGLHSGVETPIQVDLSLRVNGAVLGAQVASAAARAAELLLRITPMPRGSGDLSLYRGAFEARYGQDREVPLLELLDPNFGLGPPRGHGGAAAVDGRRLALRNETLQSMALNALAQRISVVEIDDAMLNRLALWELEAGALPFSLDVAVFVIAPSAAAVDQGRFQIALGPNLGARQAGRYVARFADMLGRQGESALLEAAAAERRHAPAAIWAELVYLPRRLRSGNVVVRPTIREKEIPVGVSPGVAADRSIPLSELRVTVHDGRLRLRWQGTDVIVRAGHMLTSFQAPPVCRFLAEVAEDGVAQLSAFDWGPAFSYPFLPRVVHERCILSPARWRIDSAARDAELGTDPRDFPEKLARFREQWKLPRYSYLALGDNRLLLDLEAPPQAEVLREELAALRAGAALVLHEALPGPEHAWIKGSRGSYLAEFIVPLVLRPFVKGGAPAPAVEDEAPPREAPAASLVNRLRPPGSDWLFVKLYCPAVLEEEFLVGPVRDFCHEVSRRRLTDGWFFVRYADPDPHIRLRFRGDPNRLLTELLPEVCAWGGEVISEGMCQKFAFDTYDREIERYGGPAGMALVEAVFTADSPAAVDLLAVLRRTSDLDRLTLAVASIDDLLSALGLDGAERQRWYKSRVRAAHLSGPDFRDRKAVLRSLLGEAGGVARLERGAALAGVFAERRRSLASVAKRLAALVDGSDLGRPLPTILESVIHMHCNRLAGADPGLEERALGLLLRVGQSLKAAPLASSMGGRGA